MTTNTTQRARFILDVEYDIAGLSPAAAQSMIRELLTAAAARLAGDGLLTGDTPLTVERMEDRVLFTTDGCIPVDEGQMRNWDAEESNGHPTRDETWRLKIDRLDERGAVHIEVNSGPKDDPAPGLGLILEIDKGRPRMMVSLGDGSDNLFDVRSVLDAAGGAKLAVYPDGNAVQVEACADPNGFVGRSYSHKRG